MITLTDAAKAHLQKKLKEKNASAAAFRLSVKKTGCSGYMYVPEIVTEKKENDIEINTANFIIYIDHDSMLLLQGTEIDYVQKSLGTSQLVFHNPNAEGLCGCGESFAVEPTKG